MMKMHKSLHLKQVSSLCQVITAIFYFQEVNDQRVKIYKCPYRKSQVKDLNG